MHRKVGKIKISVYPEKAIPLPFRYMEMDDSEAVYQDIGESSVLKNDFFDNNSCDMLADSFATDLAICLIENLNGSPQKLNSSNSIQDNF